MKMKRSKGKRGPGKNKSALDNVAVKTFLKKAKSKVKKDEFLSFKQRATSIIEDATNANDILDLLRLVQVGGDTNKVVAALHALCRVFRHFLQQRTMMTPTNKKNQQQHDETFRLWLVQQFKSVKACLLDGLIQDDIAFRIASLVSLIKLTVLEDKFPVDANWTLTDAVNGIVEKLIDSSFEQEQVIKRLDGYFAYDDFTLLVMKALKQLLKTKLNQEVSDVCLRNTYFILELVTIEDGPDDFQPNTLFQSSGKVTYESLQSSFQVVWITFLKFGFRKALHKKVLLNIHEKVMPYLAKPVLLTDFLLDTYNLGGSFSLLALNGIFFLVEKHNLEFPDFYKRFYSLFEPSVLFSQYFPRFFYLADLFLSSTHLPSYLVASFIKRLCRLALLAPPNCLLVILPFIGNLLVRHPSLSTMMNNPKCIGTLNCDPYDDKEPDPAKTSASESCLWEIQALQSHFNPAVAKAAQFIDKQLPSVEKDISAALDVTLTEMIQEEGKRIVKDTAVTFERPTGLFGNKDDHMGMYWTL